MRYLAPLLLLLLVSCPQGQDTNGENGRVAEPADTSSTSEDTLASDTPAAIVIWADNCLALPLEALREPFAEQYGHHYEVTYWERGWLMEHLASGKPVEADVFLTCDPEALAALFERKLVADATTRTFAGDRLVLIKRLGESWQAEALFDIYPLYFKWLGFGSDVTASGYYAQQAITSSGVRPRIDDRLKPLDSEGAILAALTSDDIQMGIVFASTASLHGGFEVIVEIAEDLHEDIQFTAVAGSGREDQAGVADFLMFIAEDDIAQWQLESMGLVPRIDALIEDQ